ncbi:MAG TPA: thiaminase II [Porphyromonadaceae bacterium]|nr:thiaminase II [Porphyromonadaceae bacterium]
MNWSKKAWSTIQPVYNEIIASPFIKELMQGTLPREKFIFYIRQDTLYLSDYRKVLAAIASRFDHSCYAEAFLHFAGGTMTVERNLHRLFVNELKLKPDDEIEPSPTCLLYTSYLLRQISSASLETMLGAVLPCFWIYKKVGDHILVNQTTQNNPYQSWIDTYGGEKFEKSNALAISICDEVAEKCTTEQQIAMTKAFVTCSKLEWMFWNSAYKQEQWNI